MNYLLITVRFLDDRYHGLLDRGGPSEWPPSPFRLFCALVAGVARSGQLNGDVGEALAWLQTLEPPHIIAPEAKSGRAVTRFVPNNDGDEVANRQERLTAKPLVPTLLLLDADQKPEVHYVWDIRGVHDAPTDRIQDAARSLTALGWGIDMAYADARRISGSALRNLLGVRWQPKPDYASKVGMLRVPSATTTLEECTLDDLKKCHQVNTARIEHGYPLHTVIKPRVFKSVFYTTQSENFLRPIAAFEIHRTIEDQEKEENAGKSKFRPFHHVRRVATVAGMVRNASATVVGRMGWTPEDVLRRIKGHGEGDSGQATSDDRLQFLPLPSITPVGVSGIRRVLVVGPPGFDLAPLRRRLNGEELIDENSKRPVAMLSGIPITDRNVTSFLGQARTWSTVTPVILPGYDDPDGLRAKLKARELKGIVTAEEQKNLLARLDARILALIWKAFHQAGWTTDALAGAEVEYRAVGWFRGLDLAKNYDLPPLRFPRYHLRIRFSQPVTGPVVVGAGRYRGLGVFAREA